MTEKQQRKRDRDSAFPGLPGLNIGLEPAPHPKKRKTQALTPLKSANIKKRKRDEIGPEGGVPILIEPSPERKKKKTSPPSSPEWITKKNKKTINIPIPTSYQPDDPESSIDLEESSDSGPIEEDGEEAPVTEEDRAELFIMKLRSTKTILESLLKNYMDLNILKSLVDNSGVSQTFSTVIFQIQSDFSKIHTGYKQGLLTALQKFKTFWSDSQHENLEILDKSDNFWKLYHYLKTFADDVQTKFMIKRETILFKARYLADMLDTISKTFSDKKTNDKVSALIDRQKTLLEKKIDIHSRHPDYTPSIIRNGGFRKAIEKLANIVTLQGDIEKVFDKLNKLFQKNEIVIELEPVIQYVGKDSRGEKMIFTEAGIVSYSIAGTKKYLVNKTMNSSKLNRRYAECLSISLFELMDADEEYTETASSMGEYINNNKIFEKISEEINKTLPIDIPDTSIRNDPAREYPLTVNEIYAMANYQEYLYNEREMLYSKDFYETKYKPKKDSRQQIEPGVTVLVLGDSSVPPMNVRMGVHVRKCVTKEEMSLASTTLPDLVKGSIDHGKNDSILILDMKEAPKNRYITNLKKRDEYHYKKLQWFITLNPNMSLTQSMTATKGVTTQEEFYDIAKKALSTYVPQWLTHKGYAMNPELVRLWEIEDMVEEIGGGNNRKSHIHLLLSVGILSPDEIDTKSISLNYNLINSYFSFVRKQTYFNSQKVNVDTKGVLDNSPGNAQRVKDYIHKGEKESPKYVFSKFTKGYQMPDTVQ
jgi:hypothetical protein